MQLTVRDVARLLNMSEKTIYRWIGQGRLPAYRVNEQYRFDRTELLEWVKGQRVNASADMLREPEVEYDPLPTLETALQAGGIFYRIEGTDPSSAIRSCVAAIRLEPDVDRDLVEQALLAREAIEPTGLGSGVAVPHPRSPGVLDLPASQLSLCFLERPVPFGALDGEPVHTLLVLLCSTLRTHLHLLSRLGYALQDPGVRAAIERQGTRDEIMTAVRRAERALGQREGGDGPAEAPENP